LTRTPVDAPASSATPVAPQLPNTGGGWGAGREGTEPTHR
jgi:hypothetical protein